jgi:hypothetical protein
VQNKDVTSFGSVTSFNTTSQTGTATVNMSSPAVVCTPALGSFTNVTLVMTLLLAANYGGVCATA